PGMDYLCERIGLFDVISVGRRVRWRGQLNDPNELSVYIGAVIPLMIALATMKKRHVVTGLTVIAIGLCLWAVVLTQSRGGQLVVAAVLGAYCLSRFGMKGLVLGAVIAAPVLLLGGRSTGEADASSSERLELLYHGVTAFIQHPIVGIGVDRFAESEGMTAHNAYLLAAAELGFVGFFCWSGLLWTSLKIPITVLPTPPHALAPQLPV